MPNPLALALSLLLFASGCDAQPSGQPTVDFGKKATAPALALAGRVTDAANVLTSEQEAALSAKLERLKRVTEHQMVIVTVPSLGGQDIAIFARDLANGWGIGRKDHDDGVMILVAPNERKVRLSVGYGLESRLTPDVCQKVIREEMIPRFREGDLPGGIDAGADEVIRLLK